MRCEVCVLESVTALQQSTDELLARLAECDECPLDQEDTCPGEVGRLLACQLHGAANLVRRREAQVKKARNEAREQRELASRSEERVAKLEELQKASTREADAELRAKVALVEQQQAAILAMSTPIIQVQEGVLVLPLIGTLDDARAAIMIKSLLAEIHAAGARYAVIDLTGLADLDRRTARHLVTVAAAVRLLGARVLLSGLRPHVATELVGLDVALGDLVTVRSLQDALRYCGVGGGARR